MDVRESNNNSLFNTLKISITCYPDEYADKFVETLRSNGIKDYQIQIFVDQFYKNKDITSEQYENILKILNTTNVK